MRIAVFGAGAIGGWLAAALAEAGIEVSVVARGATLSALRSDGLRVTRLGASRTVRVNAAAANELGTQDLLIVAVKAQYLSRALPDIKPLLHAGTIVLPAVNGLPWWFTQAFAGPLNNVVLESVDPGGHIAAGLPLQQVVGGVVHASICRTAPGCIRIDGIDKLILGEPSGEPSARVGRLCELFTRAGINAMASDNIRLAIWSKLWGNMNMNPISALTHATTSQLLNDPSTRALCLRMMQEMAQSGERIGLSFTMTAAERIGVTLKLGGFKTSMLHDLEAGLPLEYAPMLGAVVEVAQRLGVPAPCCETVLALVSLLSKSGAAPEAAGK